MAIRIPRPPHPWNLAPKDAMAVQERLARRVREEAPLVEPRYVAGMDAAFADAGRTCVAAVVLWDAVEGCVVEIQVARRRVTFPYIPGLLTFREGPALCQALRKLRTRPDVLLCDGQGRAHPRRLGIASHLGLICGIPSVGCAKSILVGSHSEPGQTRGSTAPLTHRGEVVGLAVRTRDQVLPVYVSVGHQFDLEAARQLVLRCAVRYRLPEPTRLADRLVARLRRTGDTWESSAGKLAMDS